MKRVDQINVSKTDYQQHNEDFNRQDSNEIQRKADYLWDLMTELYTSKWESKNGLVASSIWLEAIASLSNEQLRKGVNKCKERIFNGDAWAPDLADFLALIHGHTDVDFQAAFQRCLSKSPEGRVEQWVYENAGYNIRASNHDSAERMHKKYMKQAIEMERQGKLVLNEDRLKALPPNSVKNVNDIEREKFEQSGKKNPFQERIDKLIKG